MTKKIEDVNLLKRQLKSLELEHHEIEENISKMIINEQFNQLKIKLLKKRKLLIKDKIIRIKAKILPDIIA